MYSAPIQNRKRAQVRSIQPAAGIKTVFLFLFAAFIVPSFGVSRLCASASCGVSRRIETAYLSLSMWVRFPTGVRTVSGGQISAYDTTIVMSDGRSTVRLFLPRKTVTELRFRIKLSRCGESTAHSRTAANTAGKTAIQRGSASTNAAIEKSSHSAMTPHAAM